MTTMYTYRATAWMPKVNGRESVRYFDQSSTNQAEARGHAERWLLDQIESKGAVVGTAELHTHDVG